MLALRGLFFWKNRLKKRAKTKKFFSEFKFSKNRFLKCENILDPSLQKWSENPVRNLKIIAMSFYSPYLYKIENGKVAFVNP